MLQQQKKRVFFGFLRLFFKFFEAGSQIRPANPGFQEDDQKRPKRTIPQFPRVFATIPAAPTNFRFQTQSSTQMVLKIRESLEGKRPTYFTSKALQGHETRYQKIEKVALAPVTAAQRLRQYFLTHTIIVRTDQPIRQILGCPDVAGRMMKWSLELSEFDIHIESRKARKAQVFAGFVAEMNFPTEEMGERV